MEEFNLSFKNKRVRISFAWLTPIILITVILFIVLPREDYWIPSLFAAIATLVYEVRVMLYKRKMKKLNETDQEEI